MSKEEIRALLTKQLEKIIPDKRFREGVCDYARSAENMQMVLDFLQENPDADDQDVAFFVYELAEQEEIMQGTKAYDNSVKHER